MSLYNEGQKLEYIGQEGNNGKILRNRFRQFARYEQRYGKDLCEMGIEELKSVFAALNMVTPLTRTTTKSLINRYIEWCIRTKRTNKENSLKLLSAGDLASSNAFETKMLKSPDHVREILKIIFDGEQNWRPNKITLDQLIFWLFYSGVTDKDIQILKKDSIDYDRKIIYSPSQCASHYEVFDEVLPLWKKFMDMDEVEFEELTRSMRYSKLKTNNYLFRQFDNRKNQSEKQYLQAHIFHSYLRRMFVKYQEITGVHLLVSITNMNLSGYFYRLWVSGQTDDEVRTSIFQKTNGNKLKVRSIYCHYKEWRSYFYGI